MKRAIFATAAALTFAGAGPTADDPVFGRCLPDDCTGNVYRVTTARVLDPHFFVDPIFVGCTDATDRAPAGKRSANEDIAFAIEHDDDRDGFVDLSLLLERGRPSSEPEALMFARGNCPSDDPDTCFVDDTATVTVLEVDSRSDRACFSPDDAATSPVGYQPPVPEVPAPCFRAESDELPLQLGGTEVVLEDAIVAAQTEGATMSGVVVGFVSRERAREIEVSKKPLATYWPGGDGVCAEHDDRDRVDGRLGWWLFVGFEAETITLRPPPQMLLSGNGCPGV